MNIRKLFEYVKDVKPYAFPEQVLLRWLSEAEGKVQTEILLLSSADVITYESVMATKTVTVAVAADPDHSSDRTKDTVTVTVTDVSGDSELNHTERELLCGETVIYTMQSTDDASTAASKAVEVSRAAADAESGAGVVTVTVTVGEGEPVSETVSQGESVSEAGYADIELIVPAPYDRLYEAYLEYMIDWQEGEYNSAANTLERYNTCWSEYSTWVGDNVKPGLGCAVERGYYLSAYAIAVKHGYRGSEAEWIASMVRGKDGKDAVSPTVEIEEIQDGYELTIYDAAHPEGQTVTILDGETPTLPSWTAARGVVAALTTKYEVTCECFAIRGSVAIESPGPTLQLKLSCGGAEAASVSFGVESGSRVVTFDAELLGVNALSYNVYLDGVGVSAGIAYSESTTWGNITEAALISANGPLTIEDGEAVIATK